MVIAETLTSNVNRTIANVRTTFHKNGGNIGAAGAVSYMFDNTGVIVFEGTDPDHIFEILLDAEVDVRDVTEEEGNIVVYTEPTDLHKGIAALKEAGITEFSTTELEMIPQSEVELSPEDLEIFEGLIDALEDDDDVQKVRSEERRVGKECIITLQISNLKKKNLSLRHVFLFINLI